jgi:diacylglycerol kinase (ATP)
MRLRLIANPSAGGGRARKELPGICSAFERVGLHCDVAQTERPGHASELARDAIRDGVDVLAAMGGDGTLNEVAQAFVDPHGRPVIGPELAVVPFGTGGDFRRSFGWTPSLDEAVGRIAHGKPMQLDLGLARTRGPEAAQQLRAFINVGSFGISGIVTRLVNQSSKWLGGRASFYLAAARATFTYKNLPVQLQIDGQSVYEGPLYLAAFANGCFFGGGMRVAPAANPSDGLLDCVVHGDLSRAAAYSLTGSMYDGSHLNRPLAHAWRGRHFAARLLDTTLQSTLAPAAQARSTPLDGAVELDGESFASLPLQVEVLHHALNLRVDR